MRCLFLELTTVQSALERWKIASSYEKNSFIVSQCIAAAANSRAFMKVVCFSFELGNNLVPCGCQLPGMHSTIKFTVGYMTSIHQVWIACKSYNSRQVSGRLCAGRHLGYCWPAGLFPGALPPPTPSWPPSLPPDLEVAWGRPSCCPLASLCCSPARERSDKLLKNKWSTQSWLSVKAWIPLWYGVPQSIDFHFSLLVVAPKTYVGRLRWPSSTI